MNPLSTQERPAIRRTLQSRKFDLLVVGGGITGAGIALDAASRGFRVALVEKHDFASGTSSKSTKLVHGGLRYLKQLEIALVREVGRERAIVHELAPHLVKSEKMLLPLVKGGTYGSLATSMGLWVYDILAGVEGKDKRSMLDREETLAHEPLLRQDILQGGGYYAEYRTDDARLTIENIKTAVKHGACILNYACVEDFLYNEEKKVSGVVCRDTLDDTPFNIEASYVVSAAGPWVDQLRKTNGSISGKHLFHSKGVHIVVPHERFPVRQSVYFDNDDGRMIFAIPRQRVTYIGTTDTPYQGDLDHIPIHREDVEYLLAAANQMFPKVGLTFDDVESSWAGLRPLIYEEGKSASEMSRKDEIFESDTGLISIAGGKLTGYRKMAERVVDLLVRKQRSQNGKDLKDNHTDRIALSGGPFENARAVTAYEEEIAGKLAGYGLPSLTAKYLVHNYGRQTDTILEMLSEFNDEPAQALLRAECRFAVHHELAATLTDFFNRRTGRLYFNLPSIQPAIEPIAEDMGKYLDWSSERKKEEKDSLQQAIREVTEFEPAQQGTGVTS